MGPRVREDDTRDVVTGLHVPYATVVPALRRDPYPRDGRLIRAIAPARATTKLGGYGSSRARGRRQGCRDGIARTIRNCRPGLAPGPISQRRLFDSSYRTSMRNNKARWLWVLAFARTTLSVELPVGRLTCAIRLRDARRA